MRESFCILHFDAVSLNDVTSREFQERLQKRARVCGLDFPVSLSQSLESYYRLLEKWNDRMNLTALPLREMPDATIDRLLLEPVAAAGFVGRGAVRWFDLGSGGGSPAVPLKLVRPEARLVMVESRGRKAAFLREVVRTLTLQTAVVESCRFEELLQIDDLKGSADVVTVRAVRPDQALFEVSRHLLEPGGQLLVFGSEEGEIGGSEAGFEASERFSLARVPNVFLWTFKRVLHLER